MRQRIESCGVRIWPCQQVQAKGEMYEDLSSETTARLTGGMKKSGQGAFSKPYGKEL